VLYTWVWEEKGAGLCSAEQCWREASSACFLFASGLAPRVPAALLGVQEPSLSPRAGPLKGGTLETARTFCTKLSLFQSPFQSSTGLGSNHWGQGCPKPQPGSSPLAWASSGWLFRCAWGKCGCLFVCLCGFFFLL